MGCLPATGRSSPTGRNDPKEPARKLKTSQQQVSRLESPGYEGHSLGMLRRVAKALNDRVRVTVEAKKAA